LLEYQNFLQHCSYLSFIVFPNYFAMVQQNYFQICI